MRHYLAFVALVFLILPPARAAAQAVDWDRPVKLTADGTVVQYSAVVADLSGVIHVFWAYKQGTTQSSNALFYRYGDERGWSGVTDIVFGPEWDTFSNPTAFCDNANRIHLLFHSTQGLYYTAVPATEAMEVRQWQAPTLVVAAGAIGSAALALAPDGKLHVVYTQRLSSTNVMYVVSDDDGLFWSDPQPLSGVLAGDEHIPDAVTLVIDKHATLHVMWHESYPPEYLGRQVLYARSSNNGVSWTSPQPLSERSTGAMWNALPNLVVDAQDRLHTVWACGAPVVRCYRTSSDHGITWSGITTPLFEQLIGSAGRDAIAADIFGSVYWAGSLRYPQAFYYAVLTDGVLRVFPQPLITEAQFGGLGSAHFPNMAIGQGNHLHVTLVESDGGPLWYLHGRTSHLTVELLPEEHSPIPTEVPTETPIAQETVLSLDEKYAIPLESDRKGTGRPDPLVWSMLAVVGLIAFVGIVSTRRIQR